MRFCVRFGTAFALVIYHSSLHGQSFLIASSGFPYQPKFFRRPIFGTPKPLRYE